MKDTVTHKNIGKTSAATTSSLEATAQMTYQEFLPPHWEATVFIRKWLFYLLNDHLEYEIKCKTALLNGDSDQYQVKLLRKSQGRSCTAESIT